MKEKIKLGIPIENGETGETNIILRTNEIRIIEEAFEENERLHSIIKEVREYMKNTMEVDKEYPDYMTLEICEYQELLDILDKENI